MRLVCLELVLVRRHMEALSDLALADRQVDNVNKKPRCAIVLGQMTMQSVHGLFIPRSKSSTFGRRFSAYR